MPITQFLDLPDLVLLHVYKYLSPFDAIQAFYDLVKDNDRFIELLIECQYFSSIHHLRYPLFKFVCHDVLPKIGQRLKKIILYEHQLEFVHENNILNFLPNLSSLHLINIPLDLNEQDNHLEYILSYPWEDLRVDFAHEHHIHAEAFVCERFIFSSTQKTLRKCHLVNPCGIQLQHLDLNRNESIEELSIQLKDLTDFHLLLENLSVIRILQVDLCRWVMDEIKYDYRTLSAKLPFLVEFSLKSEHALSFDRILKMLPSFIHVRKFSLIYRNYDEFGIDIQHFQSVLSQLRHLKELHLMITFIFFQLNPKLTFDDYPSLREQWNIQTYLSPLYKTYIAYTDPFNDRNFSLSTDFLFDQQSIFCPTMKHLHLTTRATQTALAPLLQQLSTSFPSLTHLHLLDSFGTSRSDGKEEVYVPLMKISSFDASDVKFPHVFRICYQAMPNLTDLHVSLDILIRCDLRSALRHNHIKTLELITHDFEKIPDLLRYFHHLQVLMINTKKQSTPNKRKFYDSILPLFTVCSKLFTIHVKAHRLPDFFHPNRLGYDPNMHVQYSLEMLTLWR